QGSLDSKGTGLGAGTFYPVTVVAVNDPPRFTAGPNVTSDGSSGRQVFTGWATGISPGPADGSSPTVTVVVTPDNKSLFLVPPAIDPLTGTLTFTPAPGAEGTTNVQVFAKDNGGTDNGGVDASAPQTFSITLTVRLTDQNEVRQ